MAIPQPQRVDEPPPRTRRPLTRFEWGCLAVIAAAFLMRIPMILTPEVIWDSAWYLLLARSFADTGTFLLPWSEPGAPLYNGYWPPLFPIFLSPLVKAFGPSYHVLVAGAVIATAFLTTAVLLTTWNLYGRTRGFAAAAIVAASPAFLLTDSRGMSESLLVTMIVLAAWAFIKSLDRPAWLPVAGAFGLLAYLGKASLGFPFVAAGLVALAGWRVWTRGWRRVVRSAPDLLVAGTLIAGLAALVLFRSGKLGGVGLGFIGPLALGIAKPTFIATYAFKIVFVSIFLLVATLPLSLRVRAAWAARRGEREAGLWLAIGLTIFVGSIFTATFYHTEDRPLVDFDNIRYLTPALVPMLWLLLPHYDFDGNTTPRGIIHGRELRRRHLIWYGLAVGSLAALFLLNPAAAAMTLRRLQVFLLLSIIPLALALVALGTHYATATRRVDGREETRFVVAPSSDRTGTFLALALVAGALAWYVSAWYGYVGIALAVASATQSPRARVLALVLLVAAASAPSARTVFPIEDAADGVHALVPQDTLIAMHEPLVYFAAAMPEGTQLRLWHDHAPEPPPESGALLLSHREGRNPVPGYTEVAGWNYGIVPFPTLRISLQLEAWLTGESPRLPELRALTLHLADEAAPDAPAGP